MIQSYQANLIKLIYIIESFLLNLKIIQGLAEGFLFERLDFISPQQKRYNEIQELTVIIFVQTVFAEHVLPEIRAVRSFTGPHTPRFH